MNSSKLLIRLLCLTLAVPSVKVRAQGNTWAAGIPMPTSRIAPAAATINGTLFVVGGFTDAGGPLSVVEVYDPSSNSWSARSPMPTPRGRLAAAVLNGILYTVGGFGGDTTVEAYDPVVDLWTAKAPVNKGRLGAAAGVIGGKLYVVGGTTNDSVQTVEEYDPVSNSWVFKAPMPTPRFLLAAVVIGSKLYAVGGTNSVTGGPALGTLEVYDPATDSWQTNASMPTPRSDLAAAVIGGKMFVAGGFGAPGVGVTLEAYDPLLDTWSTLAPMPTSRGDLAADAVNNQLYAVGGVSAPGQTPLATVEVYTEAPPVITSPLAVSATIGQPFVYQFEANGATSLDVTGLPQNLIFDPLLRAITGTPTVLGTFNVALSASNGAGSTNAILVLTVQPLPASGPVISSPTTATGRTGTPFRFQTLTSGGSPATRLAATDLPAGLSVDPVTGEISGTATVDGSYLVTLSATDAGITNTATLQLTFKSSLAVPVIVSPNFAFLFPDLSFMFSILAPSNSGGAVSYSRLGPLPPGLGLDPATGIISGTPQNRISSRPIPSLAGGIVTNTQIFACNSSGCATQGLFFFLPTGAANISTRLSVGTEDNVLIGGFITQGNAPMKLVARGIGPSLPVIGPLPNPFLELHSGAATIAMNDNWKDNLGGGSQEVAIQNTALAPTNDLESAILAVLDPGAYTAIVKGTDNGTGVGLVEVFNLGAASLDTSSEAHLANISTRGNVQTGDNVMIGGFINQGAVPIKVLLRGIGPSLTSEGVSGALANPVLELHEPDGTTVITNDDWMATQKADITATTLAPKNALESAILLTLPVGQGAYTAIVRGVNNTTGVALVEAYFGNPCLGGSCP